MKLSELLAENQKDIEQITKEVGWKTRRVHTELWNRLWGHLEASEITPEMVEIWTRERKKTHAEATVKAEVAMLSRAYNLAKLDNPVARARVRFRPVKRHQVLTEDGEKRLRRAYVATVRNGEVMWLVEKFALLTGIRMCEQAFLRPRHVHGDTLEVPAEGKTGRRLVPMSRLAQEIAQLWIHIAREVKSDWLFFQKSSARTRHGAAAAYVRRIFRPACEVAGLAGLQRRDLRRTFASRLVNAGKQIFDVQHLLGHTNPETTMIYARVGMEQLRSSVAMFD